ncbi:MAG: DNA recombination protein RmuC [Patescibacteria group bacterium]
MEIIFLVAIASILIIGFGLIWQLLKSQKQDKAEDKSLTLLIDQIKENNRTIQSHIIDLNRTMDSKLAESTRTFQNQFGQNAKIIGEITEKLTRLDETNKQVVSFADQLKNLQDILKNPKQRGILGEYYLETVLKNVLPPGSYQMQYAFSDGVIVDAVVFIDKRIVPIDSKFSLENYNRILESAIGTPERKKYESAFIADLKLRIDETSKYVKPEEDTMDFAFMFIPSEAVYYDLLVNKVGAITDDTRNLIAYAGEKKVIIVSPTSFLAYLQTVLQGLRNQKISEQTKEIIKHVENLRKHLKTYDDHFIKVGKNITLTVGSYNNAYKEFTKIDKDVLKITGTAVGTDPLTLEKPRELEEIE